MAQLALVLDLAVWISLGLEIFKAEFMDRRYSTMRVYSRAACATVSWAERGAFIQFFHQTYPASLTVREDVGSTTSLLILLLILYVLMRIAPSFISQYTIPITALKRKMVLVVALVGVSVINSMTTFTSPSLWLSAVTTFGLVAISIAGTFRLLINLEELCLSIEDAIERRVSLTSKPQISN